MSDFKLTGENGPVYSVPLIDSLPLNDGSSFRQAMPSLADLKQAARVNLRVVAGYEVLLEHYVTLLEQTKENTTAASR